ncbi:MAG: hypothetical protein DRH12_18815, partial [Deltaproteobacteria bacterium]
SLKEIAIDIQPGFARQPKDGSESLPQLRTNNISPEGHLDLSLVKNVPVSTREIERYSLRPGDILFNNTNSADLVGKTAFFDNDDGLFLFSNHMTRIRVNEKFADPRYIARYLYWTWKTGGFRRMVTRWVNQAAINKKMLGSVAVPLPPPSEQRRIVEILDQADALRKKRAEADAKATRILPALFYKMFGDPATNPKGWPIKTLRELSIGGPQYGANAKAIDYKTGAPRYVRITDITDDGHLTDADIKTLDLDDWETYRLVEGDLLFARSGATVGKTYLYQPEDGLCAYAGYLIRFKLDTTSIDPWVVFAFTHTPYYHLWVASKRRTAAQPNINGQEYASLRLPQPDRQTQQQFVCLARELRASHGKRKQVASRIQKLFDVLLHRAFTGDLTAQWREAHMKELLEEMEQQVRALGA